MVGVLNEATPDGLLTFVVITLIIGGAGAWAAGRALARTWRPIAMIGLYMLFLTAGVRFLHYALTLFYKFYLAAEFILGGPLNTAEAIEVFYLGTLAKLRSAFWRHRYIDVKAHITVVQVTVRHACICHESVEFGRKSFGLLR